MIASCYIATGKGVTGFRLTEIRRKIPASIEDKVRVVYAGCGVNALSGYKPR